MSPTPLALLAGPAGARGLRVPMRLTPLLLVLAPAAAADTLVVGPPGSGAEYDDLPAAVAAAAPGDTVCVLPGDYQKVATIVIDKPLALVGSGSAVTRYSALPWAPWDLPLPLEIRNLAAGEEVRVAGIELRSVGFGAGVLGPTGVVVRDCDGPVVLADVLVQGGSSGGFGAVQVRSSAQVTLVGCRSIGGSADVSSAGQPGLLVEGSHVHVNACEIVGALGVLDFTPGGGVATDGGPGLLAVDSTVRVARSLVRGGDGGGDQIFFPATHPGDGAPGILALGSDVLVRGGAGADVKGGAGGTATAGGSPVHGAGAPAAVLDAASLLTATIDVPLAAGADGGGAVTAPDVDPGGGAFVPLSARLATLAAAPVVVATGSIAVLSAGAEPGGVVLPFFSFGQDPAFEIPGLPGTIVLDVDAFAALPPVVVDGTGEGSLPVAIPPVSALQGTSVLVQGLAQAPGGALSVSAPALVAIRI